MFSIRLLSLKVFKIHLRDYNLYLFENTKVDRSYALRLVKSLKNI